MKCMLCMLLICLLAVPALAETVQDQALAFIQDAGIAADSVMRAGDEVTVTLTDGGTAALLSEGDFDPFNLSWRFDGAADEDVALYLDYALGLLAQIEAKVPADTETLSAAEVIRARNNASMVEHGLDSMECLGKQGLRVLLLQLAEQDGSGLNSLRARLALQLLETLLPEDAEE